MPADSPGKVESGSEDVVVETEEYPRLLCACEEVISPPR